MSDPFPFLPRDYLALGWALFIKLSTQDTESHLYHRLKETSIPMAWHRKKTTNSSLYLRGLS